MRCGGGVTVLNVHPPVYFPAFLFLVQPKAAVNYIWFQVGRKERERDVRSTAKCVQLIYINIERKTEQEKKGAVASSTRKLWSACLTKYISRVLGINETYLFPQRQLVELTFYSSHPEDNITPAYTS